VNKKAKREHVCTSCGRKVGILHLPPHNTDPDNPVHPGERLCGMCLDSRLVGKDGMNVNKKPATSCCGGSEEAGCICQHKQDDDARYTICDSCES